MKAVIRVVMFTDRYGTCLKGIQLSIMCQGSEYDFYLGTKKAPNETRNTNLQLLSFLC